MARQMTQEGDTAAYQSEHWLAWVFAVIAIVLGVMGLLVGFDVLDIRDDVVGGGAVASARDFDEALLWMLPAIGAAVLSLALHRTEHHRSRSAAARTETADTNLYRVEHGAAYLVALAAIVAGVAGMLVGYDVFDNGNTERDGYLWVIGGIVLTVLTNTLHSVRHHQMVAEEDVIVRIIEERAGRVPAAAPRERAAERPGETTT